MPAISQRYDILSLIQRYANITVTGKANVYNRELGCTFTEYHSNCPFCPGSHDSFIMQPELGRASHAIRSGCGWRGDGIDFLVDYCKMERWQAIEELALEHVSFYHAKPEPKRSQYSPPPQKWQETANIFVDWAARYLWSSSPKAQEALAYLRARGLEDAMIRKKKYGYCPLQSDGRWYGTDPLHGGLEHWGIDPMSVSEKIRERGTILVPPGIVIPWYEQETLWKIAVRRLDEPDPDRRYRSVAGSVDALYNVDSIVVSGFGCMIVESEFCAASIEQVADDLVSVIATGSADKGRNFHFVPTLCLPSCLIQSFDNDAPDEQGKRPGDVGARYWISLYDHCFRHKPSAAKDPNDMLRRYGRTYVRDWVLRALDRWEELQAADTLARVS